jgi:hypothetical protein
VVIAVGFKAEHICCSTYPLTDCPCIAVILKTILGGKINSDVYLRINKVFFTKTCEKN